MELHGAKDLQDLLSGLGDRVLRKVARQAVSAGATPIQGSAKANAPEESGLLKKSIKKRVRTYKDSQTVVAIVGPDSSVKGEYKGKKRWPAKYAHLVEDGHIDSKGNHVPGHPFIRPAADANASRSVQIIEQKMASGIEREAAKRD
jgi:HK97 gp10 family phage protein